MQNEINSNGHVAHVIHVKLHLIHSFPPTNPQIQTNLTLPHFLSIPVQLSIITSTHSLTLCDSSFLSPWQVCLKPYLSHAPPFFRPPPCPLLPDPPPSGSPSLGDSRSNQFAHRWSLAPLRISLVVVVESSVRRRTPLSKVCTFRSLAHQFFIWNFWLLFGGCSDSGEILL